MSVQAKIEKLMNKYNDKIHQRGAASLVFVLMVSLVMLATTTGVFKNVKNTQEIGTAINAMSHAETGTWTAAEAFRLYLEAIDSDEIRQLSDSIPITMDQVFGSLSAENINVVETSPDAFQVGVTLINLHAAAQSSARLQVVYSVGSAAAQADSIPTTATVTFNKDLGVNGGIELFNNGDPVNLTIDGDVNLGGVSVNPINELKVTGKVTIGSKVEISAIYADDDVTLANTEADIVRTMGDFTATGSAAVGSIQANGDVLIQASGDFDQISSRGNITINAGGGTQGIVTAGGKIEVQGTSLIESANAVGDVSFNNWFRVNNAVSMGNITCASQWWTMTNSLSANGSLINCPANSGSLHAESGASNTVTPPAEISPITLLKPAIDVWALTDDVNYFVAYDTTLNQIVVTVNAINGLADGSEYTLGKFTESGAPYLDYLCSTKDSAGNCTSPSSPTLPLCFGQSLYNTCISYSSSNNTFDVSPNQTAPGVMFFDGNVRLSNGHSITTILASGDISTAGSFEHWAANRGAYDKVCAANADHAKNSVRSRYTEAYSNHYPTNLCDVSNSVYTAIATANIGLAAGGINPDESVNPTGSFTGGDIDLGASTDIEGAVLAGNILTTNGNVSITGLVSTAGSGDSSSGNNSLGGKTTIDLSSSGSYDSMDLPDMGEAEPAGPTETSATLLWSRPL